MPHPPQRASAFLVITVCTALLNLGSGDKYEALTKFIEDNGGKVRVAVGLNKNGCRSLFAKEDIAEGEPLFSIPGQCILNTGSATGSFLTPALNLLREQLHPNSRFRPYLDVFPDRGSVINACTLDEKYWTLLESGYWSDFVSSWQYYLSRALCGDINGGLEITIQEMLGNVNLTLDDLKEACAVTATRYVEIKARGRLLMTPILDMTNHHPDCPHYLSPYVDSNLIHMIAGQDVKAGDEICNDYGLTRDDYAFVHYGFVPEAIDPPKLFLVDHHQFKPNAHHQEYTQEQFEADDADKYAAELKRLQGIQAQLIQLDADAAANKTRPATGIDPIFDLLLDLQVRRRTAIAYHIKRIQGILASLWLPA